MSETSISIFPNPASSVLTIDFGRLVGRTDYTMVDATGRAVITDHATWDRKTIDVSTVANGVYVLRLRTSGKAWSTRILVQH